MKLFNCERMERAPIRIRTDAVSMDGMLELPSNPLGVILFVRDVGRTRIDSCDNYVASVLREAKLGTLLINLVTEDEDQDERNIDFLARRLRAVVDNLSHFHGAADLPFFLFGVGTGAAVAIEAAAMRESDISACVCCGGRADLVGQLALKIFVTPSMFVVAGLDADTVDLNRNVFARLRCEKKMHVVADTAALFEVPAIDIVAGLARDWFLAHLAPRLQPRLSTAMSLSTIGC